MAKTISTNTVMMKLFGKTGLSESKKINKSIQKKFNVDIYAEAYAAIIADKYKAKAENYALRYYVKTKLAKGESLSDIKNKVKATGVDIWANIKYLIKKLILFIKQLILKLFDKTNILKKCNKILEKVIIQLRAIKSQGVEDVTINSTKYLFFKNPLANMVSATIDSVFLGNLNDASLKNSFEILMQLEKYFSSKNISIPGFTKEFEHEIEILQNSRDNMVSPKEHYQNVVNMINSLRSKKIDNKSEGITTVIKCLQDIFVQSSVYSILFLGFSTILDNTNTVTVKKKNTKNTSEVKKSIDELINQVYSLMKISVANINLIEEINYTKKILDTVNLALSTQKTIKGNTEANQKSVDKLRSQISNTTKKYADVSRTSNKIAKYIITYTKEIQNISLTIKNNKSKKTK